jgi:hypothetical protein
VLHKGYNSPRMIDVSLPDVADFAWASTGFPEDDEKVVQSGVDSAYSRRCS